MKEISWVLKYIAARGLYNNEDDNDETNAELRKRQHKAGLVIPFAPYTGPLAEVQLILS
jgi:hypothetical protein